MPPTPCYITFVPEATTDVHHSDRQLQGSAQH